MVPDATAGTVSRIRSASLELPLLGPLYEVGHFVASGEAASSETGRRS